MKVGEMFRPGMRAYIIPLVAGITLVISAFLPWIRIGDVTLTGLPDATGLWIIVLGCLAILLAVLSLITRKNSRHPLLLVGLFAAGLMFLSWRLMPGAVADRLATRSQALAIVEHTAVPASPTATIGSGIYLGLAAAVVIVCFGLTIVVKPVAKPYAADPDDDV